MSQPPPPPPPPAHDPNDRSLQFDTFEPAAAGTGPAQGPGGPPPQHPPLPSGPEAEIDPQRLQAFLDELRWRQSLPMAVLAGVVAAALGAVIWGVITAVSGYQIGLVAVGIGLLVGFAVRTLGKGIDRRFSVVGALFSLLGCFVGNLLAACIIASRDLGIPLLDFLAHMTPGLASELIRLTFSLMDLLFYAIAVYEGYRFSLRRITPEEIAALSRPAGPAVR